MNYSVSILINESTDPDIGHPHFIYGWLPGHPLRLATHGGIEAESVQDCLNKAWLIFNADDGSQLPPELQQYAPWTDEYRTNRNRSLSIGDVVQVGDERWCPVAVGWQRTKDIANDLLAKRGLFGRTATPSV